MWQWLKILALGKAVLITQGPVDIGNDWKRLTPPVPLSVMDDGAHIDIFMNPSAPLPASPVEKEVTMQAHFPADCVTARLQSDDDKRVTLHNTEQRITGDGAYLILHAAGAFPRHQVYTRLWVRATCPLNHVTVLWKNNGAEATP